MMCFDYANWNWPIIGGMVAAFLTSLGVVALRGTKDEIKDNDS